MKDSVQSAHPRQQQPRAGSEFRSESSEVGGALGSWHSCRRFFAAGSNLCGSLATVTRHARKSAKEEGTEEGARTSDRLVGGRAGIQRRDDVRDPPVRPHLLDDPCHGVGGDRLQGRVGGDGAELHERA